MDGPPDSVFARISRRPGALVALLLVVVLAPVLAVIVTRWGHPYLPLSDEATVALRVRDVFTSESPLVGAYSRGFNHPGPAFFWVLAPLSGTFGGASWTMPVGTALVQGGALVWLVLLARRRGGMAFAVAVALMANLAYVGMDVHDAFLRAWNPYVAFPVFLLFLFQVWSLSDGEVRQLPWIALTGSFVVQCHLGYAPLVAVAVAWAVIAAWFGRRHDPGAERVRWPRVLGMTAAILVVLWTPAIVDQVTADRGNLGAIKDYFAHPSSVLGVRGGAGIFADEFRVLPPWLGGSAVERFGHVGVVAASLAWLVVPVALAAVGWWAARRNGRRSDRRLVDLAIVMALVAVVALSRLSVEPDAFLFFWRVAVAVFLAFACGVAVVHAFPDTARRFRTPVLAMLGAGLIVTSVVAVADVVDLRDGFGPNEGEFASLMRQVRRPGLPREPVLVRAVGDRKSGFDQGLVNALDDAGVSVKVDEEVGYHFGHARGAPVAAVDEVWIVTEGGATRESMLATRGARRVASVSPLSAAEERELSSLQRNAADAINRAGRKPSTLPLDSDWIAVMLDQDPVPGISRHDAARIAELNSKVARSGGCRCAIVAVPSDSAPPFVEQYG